MSPAVLCTFPVCIVTERLAVAESLRLKRNCLLACHLCTLFTPYLTFTILHAIQIMGTTFCMCICCCCSLSAFLICRTTATTSWQIRSVSSVLSRAVCLKVTLGMHAGMLLLKQRWMPATPGSAMSPLARVISTTMTPRIVWKRLRREWGNLWRGGYPPLSREFVRHLCAGGCRACALAQAMLGVSGAGMGFGSNCLG